MALPPRRARGTPRRGGQDALVRQQPALPSDTSRVAGKPPVRPHHAVAGNDDPDRVGPIRRADGARRGCCADGPGELPVRYGSSRGHPAQAGPHLALERRPAGGDGNARQGIERAREVRLETARHAQRAPGRPELEPTESAHEPRSLQRPALREVEGAETAIADREPDGPDGRTDIGDLERHDDPSSRSRRAAGLGPAAHRYIAAYARHGPPPPAKRS